MLKDERVHLSVEEISKDVFEAWMRGKDVKSVVGHADTAAVLGVPFNRENVKLERGDEIFVAQLQGGRLPEGATTLPEGFSFKYYWVSVE